MLAGLTTGHMVGLAVVAAIFIAFALASSFLAPRRWPDFPGKNGLSVFMIISLVLFVAMLTAVEVFGVEKPEQEKEKPTEQRSSLQVQTAVAAGPARVNLASLSRS